VNATAARQGNKARVTLTWTDVANESGYRIQRATDAAFTSDVVTSTVGGNTTTFNTGNVARNTNFYFRIQAYNSAGSSGWAEATPFPVPTP
jgi:titin